MVLLKTILPLAVLFAFAGCGGKVIDVGSNVGPTGDRATAEAGGSDSPGVDSLGPSAGGSAPPTATDPSQGKCPVPSSSNPGADPSTSCSIIGGWSILDPFNKPEQTIEFTSEGTFYGGPPGTNVSQGYTFDGQYSIGPAPAGSGWPGIGINILSS